MPRSVATMRSPRTTEGSASRPTVCAASATERAAPSAPPAATAVSVTSPTMARSSQPGVDTAGRTLATWVALIGLARSAGSSSPR